MKGRKVVIGIDLGTGGARVVASDRDGNITASGEQPLAEPSPARPAGYCEQDTSDWWNATATALRQVASGLAGESRPLAIAVDSTSGTIVPVDENGNALAPAIMHNDTRASRQADEVAAAAGHPVSATFALPKALWIKQETPEVFRRTTRFVHETDFVVGKLTGTFDVSDTFNVLKMGYDLNEDKWPEFIETKLGIPLKMLPEVVEPGEVIGRVSGEASEETGIPKGTPVVAGATDSNAAFFASGATCEGEWNSTLGTSLAFKGISRSYITDTLGRVYCHRHPERLWLPGSASNTGADCMRVMFGNEYESLNETVVGHFPSRLIVYPLVRKGERFPFIDEDAGGFIVGDPTDRLNLFAAYMEGVAYVERWAYELFESLGAPVGDTVYATGGGARSDTWLRVRANVLNRVIARSAVAESAMGAAIIAASRTMYASLSEASRNMVKLDLKIEPEPHTARRYDELYARFRQETSKRGYG
jgi:xylulokinase